MGIYPLGTSARNQRSEPAFGTNAWADPGLMLRLRFVRIDIRVVVGLLLVFVLLRLLGLLLLALLFG